MSNEPTFPVIDRDGVVAFPDAPPAGRFGRATAAIATVVFALVLVGTSLVDLLAPAPFPTLIGAEKRQDTRLREQARPWDGSLFRLWEHDLRLRSRVRRSVTDTYGWFLYRHLGKLQGNLVVGPRGWLFLVPRTKVPEETDRALALRAGAVLAAVDRRIHALGMRAVIIPVPRKAAVHAVELPRRVDSRPEIDRAVVRDLERRGVVVTDLWTAFEHDLSGPAFHMLGSHWADEAQFVAAREVATTCGREVDRDGEPREFTSRGPTVEGVDTDLLRLGGILGEYQLPEMAARMVFNLVETKGVSLAPLLPDTAGRVVIIGTSFTQRRKFPTFVAHYLGEGVWNGARAGTFPGESLADFLRTTYESGTTELLLFEVPCHHLILQPLEAIANPVFAESPPATVLRYRHVRDGNLLVPVGETVSIAHGRPPVNIPLGTIARLVGYELPIVEIPKGTIAHTGDGVVALRVGGSSAGEVLLRLESPGGEDLTVPWRNEVGVVDVPLVAVGPAAEAVRFSAFAAGPGARDATFAVATVELVSEVPPLPRLDIGAPAPEAAADGWQVVIEQMPDHELGALSLLELGLAVTGPFDGVLRLEVLTNGARQRFQVEWDGLSKGALVVVSLAPLRGLSIESIRLTGSGDPPPRLLHRAILRPGA